MRHNEPRGLKPDGRAPAPYRRTDRLDYADDGHPFMLTAILMATTRDLIGWDPTVIAAVAVLGALFYVNGALRGLEGIVSAGVREVRGA